MISTDLFEPLCFAFSIPGKRVFHIVCIERALTLFSSLLLSLLYSCNMSSPYESDVVVVVLSLINENHSPQTHNCSYCSLGVVLLLSSLHCMPRCNHMERRRTTRTAVLRHCLFHTVLDRLNGFSWSFFKRQHSDRIAQFRIQSARFENTSQWFRFFTES